MSTESERHLEALIRQAGFAPSDLGIDRDEAWAKIFHHGKYELLEARYDVTSTDETVAAALIQQAEQRGIKPRRLQEVSS